MPDEPRFLGTILQALIPLVVAIIIAAIGGFLLGLFWFGTGWIFG